MQRIAVLNQDKDLISLFNRLDKGTPSQPSIIQQLRANHKMQMAGKVIQATEMSKLKKKVAHKKSRSTKTIHSNHWDSDVREAVEEQKALDNEAEKEQAAEKAWKEQEKADKRIADETQKAFNKAAKEAKAIETQKKKEEAALEKIKKAGERAEKKAQKEAEKAVKAAEKALKMTTRKKPSKKAWNGIPSQSQEDLSVIEEESSESKDIQAMDPVDIEETQLPPVDQLGYENNDDNNVTAQLAFELQNTLTIDPISESSSSAPHCPTRSQQSRRQLNKYGSSR